MRSEARIDQVALSMQIYSTTYSRNRDNARLFFIVSDYHASARVPSLLPNARSDTKEILYQFEFSVWTMVIMQVSSIRGAVSISVSVNCLSRAWNQAILPYTSHPRRHPPVRPHRRRPPRCRCGRGAWPYHPMPPSRPLPRGWERRSPSSRL
jgi:hypothetical protein